jgi:hypothetical protein
VTEQEWLACTDPQKMLEALRASGKASDRKLRLFAVACCRRSWPLLTDERSREAVEVAERYADGLVNRRALRFAFSCAADAFAHAASTHTADPQAAAGVANAAHPEAGYYARCVTPRKGHPGFLRDLFGPLPFRPVTVPPAWQTPQVVALAQAAYEQRGPPAGTLDLARLAVLAGALEEAGCDQADLLDHLRGPGPHVRGCWAVDLLLGKE